MDHGIRYWCAPRSKSPPGLGLPFGAGSGRGARQRDGVPICARARRIWCQEVGRLNVSAAPEAPFLRFESALDAGRKSPPTSIPCWPSSVGAPGPRAGMRRSNGRSSRWANSPFSACPPTRIFGPYRPSRTPGALPRPLRPRAFRPVPRPRASNTATLDKVLIAAALGFREFRDQVFDVPEPYASMGRWELDHGLQIDGRRPCARNRDRPPPPPGREHRRTRSRSDCGGRLRSLQGHQAMEVAGLVVPFRARALRGSPQQISPATGGRSKSRLRAIRERSSAATEPVFQAPMPGAVVSIHKRISQRSHQTRRNAEYVESMKLRMWPSAVPRDGRVPLRVPARGGEKVKRTRRSCASTAEVRRGVRRCD